MLHRQVRLAILLSLSILGTVPPSPTFAQSNEELFAFNRQVDKLVQAGRHSEALATAQRALSLVERRFGADHPHSASWINMIAYLHNVQGRYGDAERLYKTALAIREKALGPNHPDVAATLNNLAGSYQDQGRYADAEPLFRRALAIREKAFGPNHGEVAESLNNLALLLSAQGRYPEAEPLFRRGLAIREKAHGPESREAANSLFGLAKLYQQQGRYAEAELYAKRDLAIEEKQLGGDNLEVAASVDNLATIYFYLNRFNEAEPLYKRSLALRERLLGSDHPDVGSTLNNLAATYTGQNKLGEAEPLYMRSLSIREKVLGSDNLVLGPTNNNLGTLYHQLGRYADAERHYKRALAIWAKNLGSDHPDVGVALFNLARAYRSQHDFANAEAAYRRSAEMTIRRSRRGNDAIGQALTGKVESEATRARRRFAEWIQVAYRLGEEERSRLPELMRTTFQAGQSAQGSEAAASLAQMAARLAKGDGTLAQLVRQRQDLATEWREKEKLLIQVRSDSSGRRDAIIEQALSARHAAIDTKISEIDKRLGKEFPDYSALANPEALTIEAVQAQLAANEALVVFFDTEQAAPIDEGTFVWAVTKTNVRWGRSSFGTKSLIGNVAALRCGLDQAAWDGEGGAQCARVLASASNPAEIAAGGLLPFDLARAHTLYVALFGTIEDLIKDRHLLIVPSGALTALPFQALVTEKPSTALPTTPAGYANAAWLARRHAITILPSVASLKALRQFAKASKAAQPFVGFGNPLLAGPTGGDRSAWDRQSCSKQPPAGLRVAGRSVRAPPSQIFRGNLADVELIRRQYPLPETADELCAVAQAIGASPATVHLGDKATEKTIKALSASGALANARVVHFATHGLLARESGIVGLKAEPGLILTPPGRPSEEDDGLLTASEVANLKLDADWIVLSACNTAAGRGTDLGSDEALSGLARAFFYAGARALLVSHWAVNSQATVRLITKTFDEIKADPKIGRAEALRRSMLALIAADGFAHPADWAPFVVVGEGAR